MEFACSHVVCNWRPDNPGAASNSVSLRQSVTEHHYDNRVAVKQQAESGPAPPPLPPRRLKTPKQPRPASLPHPHPRPRPPPPSFRPPPPPSFPPPPLPPRGEGMEGENRLKANVNVLSLSIGKLVDVSKASGLESFQSPVNCGKCSAAWSSLSSIQKHLWVCEFCGRQNSVDSSSVCVGQRGGVCADVLYLPAQADDDYQNLEDTLVVFCVDISGSMSVTTEVTSTNSIGSTTYISRLQGIQDALQRALSSLLQHSPRRRVALVTFNDEVVIYGDGASTPLSLRDWALVDYDHIWQQGVAYSIPHCIAESHHQLAQRVKELREHGATSLGPAVLVSVAMASRYPGSKVILCTDGSANIGLGEVEQIPSSFASSPLSSYFYKQLSLQATESGVIVSVMTFEGTDCRLAEIGRLADTTGGRVNIVNIGTVATEIQSDMVDNVLATGATATLLAPDGVYFPFEDDSNHKLVREIGNVTEGLEITFQFAVKPESVEGFLQRDRLPFQLQLSFKTRDQQRVTRIITEQRQVTISSRVWAGSLNMAVLGVHCAQLCARLTMEGRVQEAQRQLKAQQDLLKDIRKQRPIHKEESIYGNWMDTMTTICDDLTTESLALSDEAAKVVYQMKRASSVNSNNDAVQSQKPIRKKQALMEGM
uniref:circularly permutated Ras protein 1 n=1 Tax=Centroberyx gerrardi TaxID=166262 RepID=UPI003AABEFBA